MCSKATYLRRKEQGVCTQCGGPIEVPGGMCEKCKEKQRIRRIENRKYAIAHHICPRCGRNKVLIGKSCSDCLQKQSDYREKNKDEINSKNAIYYKDRYERLKLEGICTKCAKRKAMTNKTMCSICLGRKRDYAENYYKEDINRHERPAYGLCYFCGDKLDGEWRICSKCRDRCINNLPKTPHKNEQWDRDNIALFKRY